MELHPAQLPEFRQARAELIDAMPIKCGSCPAARVKAGRIAMEAIGGEIVLEDAVYQFEEDLNKNCRGQQVKTRGCFPSTSCGYGPRRVIVN